MISLGLNGIAVGMPMHDAAAALVVDGVLIAAVEEERINRVKRSIRLPPTHAIREVVGIAGIEASDIDVVAYGWSPQILGASVDDPIRSVQETIRRSGLTLRDTVKFEFIEHHVAHAWSGVLFVPADLPRDRVDILCVDGSGESTSGAFFRLDHGNLERLWNLALEASLGLYYEAATAALGFGWGEEGKTMGLASYGHPVKCIDLPSLPDVRFAGALPRHPNKRSAIDHYNRTNPGYRKSFAGLVEEGDSFMRRADIASSVQQYIGGRLKTYVNEIQNPAPVLVLTGGVALNCSINGAIAAQCAERGIRVVIPPPASDTGIAIGAAIAVSDGPHKVRPSEDVYLGRGFSVEMIVQAVEKLGLKPSGTSPSDVATLLFDSSAVGGWFEGRAEVGPRALGRRCIVARPDSTRVRDKVNYLKGRESWRPLAPSVTGAEFSRSFIGISSPHMLIASTARPDAAARLAGVVHVDNTVRAQTVDDHSAFHQLLIEAGRRSGSEAVVCTSFNPAGEPIVYSPEDALRAAITMRLDFLAGDGWAVDLRSPL